MSHPIPPAGAPSEALADAAPPASTGPLAGLKVVEFAAIGPVPMAAMLLSDMGADVVCLARPGGRVSDPRSIIPRGRRWMELDLKHPDAAAQARALMAEADVVLEGFRPGVMERLGRGPAAAPLRRARGLLPAAAQG